MGDDSDRDSGRSSPPRAASSREERLAQALRANLKRRKEQIRGSRDDTGGRETREAVGESRAGDDIFRPDK